MCCRLFFWAGGESASGAAKGEGGESALELGVVVVCFLFLGRRGGESASGVGVVVVFFCGEWRRVSFQGGEGGRGASQLWSWVLLLSAFLGGAGGQSASGL